MNEAQATTDSDVEQSQLTVGHTSGLLTVLYRTQRLLRADRPPYGVSSICACNSLTRRAAAALVFVTGAFALVSERICEVALAGALIADAAELDEAPADCIPIKAPEGRAARACGVTVLKVAA